MSRGRHRSGRRSRPRGGRRFLLFAPQRPPGRRRRGRGQPAHRIADQDLARVAAGIAAVSAQLEALRLDVEVLGGRLDAMATRLERPAATPPPAPVVVAAPDVPPRAGPALRLPLVRAALAEPVPTDPAPAVVPAQQVRGTAATGPPARTPDVA